MKKILLIFTGVFLSQKAFANQPKDWQLGFQEAASETMRDIVAFHDKSFITNNNCDKCFCFIFNALCLCKI